MKPSIFKLRGICIEIKEYLIVGLMVTLFMNFIFSQSKVPSNSMETTIMTKDRLVVSMLPYYYRNPERGEIVVFKHGKQYWVKRVVGLPGDTIDIRDGDVYINDVYYDESAYLAESGISTPDPDYMPLEFPYVVEEGHYLLMGDNRLSSYDSRYIGTVDESLIVGKAIYRLYPFNQMGTLK